MPKNRHRLLYKKSSIVFLPKRICAERIFTETNFCRVYKIRYFLLHRENLTWHFCVSGSLYPLEAALKNGGSRDQSTTATLSIVPTKEDDGAVFRCEVWNRALPEEKKLISTVALSVNCKYTIITPWAQFYELFAIILISLQLPTDEV